MEISEHMRSEVHVCCQFDQLSFMFCYYIKSFPRDNKNIGLNCTNGSTILFSYFYFVRLESAPSLLFIMASIFIICSIVSFKLDFEHMGLRLLSYTRKN